MTQTELLRFSVILEQGIEKQAMGLLGRAAGNAAGAIGWGAGKGMVGAGMAARGVGRAAGTVGRVLKTPIPLPNGQIFRNLAQEARVGYREGAGTTAPASALHGPNPLSGPPMPEGYLKAPTPMPNYPRGNPSAFNFKPTPVGVPPRQTFNPGASAPAPGIMDKAKTFWSGQSLPMKAALGYGGVTAATAPSNMVNNAHANWQDQHPIMSALGRTFGGMKDYQHHNYLMPSFLQS